MRRLGVKLLKWCGAALALVFLAVLGLIIWAGQSVESRRAVTYAVPPDSLAPFASTADVALGKRIVEVRGGCVDCHGKDLGGANVINDPAMGNINAANLTPAALAKWSDDEIGRAIRHGIGRDGRALFFMPSTDFVGLSGGDVASIVAYLRSVPSVERPPHTITLGPLAKVLTATGQIPIALTAETIDHSRPFPTKPTEEATPEFGRYLAHACTGCHNSDFSGGPIPGAPPEWAPAADLTQRALASWSEADFVKAMRTGVNATGATLRPPFPLGLTSQMSDVELKALWSFLKTVPPPPGEGMAAKIID
jgi:cytochrome c5